VDSDSLQHITSVSLSKPDKIMIPQNTVEKLNSVNNFKSGTRPPPSNSKPDKIMIPRKTEEKLNKVNTIKKAVVNANK
jgi:hypothetical protein